MKKPHCTLADTASIRSWLLNRIWIHWFPARNHLVCSSRSLHAAVISRDELIHISSSCMACSFIHCSCCRICSIAPYSLYADYPTWWMMKCKREQTIRQLVYLNAFTGDWYSPGTVYRQASWYKTRIAVEDPVFFTSTITTMDLLNKGPTAVNFISDKMETCKCEALVY